MTTTTAADTANLVKCGKAHGYHASVADVRRCYNGEDVPLVKVEQANGPRCTGDQIRSTKKLLARHGLATSKPVESYGRREISPLMDYLYNNKPGMLSARDLKSFGLIQSRDGASLAPGQAANYTDPKAREGYVQVPGLDNVWVPENGRSIFDDVDEVDASQATIQRHIRSTKPQQRFDSQTLEDGFYVLNGVVYKVVVAVHGSGRKYARRLDSEGKWVRTPGLSQLRPEHKMTLKEALATAKRHGLNVQSQLYGRCFVCGRTLTDDESIENGIGPVCAGKFA